MKSRKVQAVEFWGRKDRDFGDVKVRYFDGSDDFFPRCERSTAEQLADDNGVALDVFSPDAR
jgi:hypothetical protein